MELEKKNHIDRLSAIISKYFGGGEEFGIVTDESGNKLNACINTRKLSELAAKTFITNPDKAKVAAETVVELLNLKLTQTMKNILIDKIAKGEVYIEGAFPVDPLKIFRKDGKLLAVMLEGKLG